MLDEAAIKYATALSGAYLFGAPGEDQTPADRDEYLNVQKENDWLLQQVKPYNGRLTGFCSENPLKGLCRKRDQTVCDHRLPRSQVALYRRRCRFTESQAYRKTKSRLLGGQCR